MTDDATDINAILAGSPVAVTIAPGEYRISTPLVLPVTVGSVGARGVKIIVGKDFDGFAAVVASGEHKDRIRECRIEGLEIDCKGKPVVGFFSNYSRRLYLDDLWIHHSVSEGLRLWNAWDLHMRRCWILDCGSIDVPAMTMAGDEGESGTRTATLKDCTWQRFAGCGLSLRNQKTVRVVNPKFEGVSRVQGLPMSDLAVNIAYCDGVQIDGPQFVLVRHDVEVFRSMAVTIESPINRISGRGFEGVEQ